MAKHKAGKKPAKKEEGQPVNPAVPEVFPERKNVTPLSAEEKGHWSEMVIGRTICPLCHQLMKVLNDDGLSGDPRYDYIENHPGVGFNRGSLCFKSEYQV